MKRGHVTGHKKERKGSTDWYKENELPRSKLRGIKPPLAFSHGPAREKAEASCEESDPRD
jgi:hypothetical protein